MNQINNPTLLNKKILINAGPTHEAIDPVRFIGNHSSGKMGFAIADAFAEAGAEVILVSGPTDLSPTRSEINLIRVTSAAEMYEQCKLFADSTDVAVFTAAVADFTPKTVSNKKLKRAKDDLEIQLMPTLDIAAELGKKKRPGQLFVGFALETEGGLENARGKLQRKNLDLIVLNSLKDKGAGFGTDTNKITMIDKSGNIDKFDLKQKKEVAHDIIIKISKLLNNA